MYLAGWLAMRSAIVRVVSSDLGIELKLLLGAKKLLLKNCRVGLTSVWTRSSAGKVDDFVRIWRCMTFEVEILLDLFVVWIREPVR